MRPGDHIGWVFDGPGGFDALAVPFLAEGLLRGEQVMYVAADPDPGIAGRIGGSAQVARIADVYGAGKVIDPAVPLSAFTAVIVQALTAGYCGFRVAVDNTSLITSETQLAAWLRWEMIADRFISDHPVTAVCAFDRTQVGTDRLRNLASLHPLSSAAAPEPSCRLFAEDGRLRVEGRVDSFTVTRIPMALEALPPRTGVLIDLAESRVTGQALQRLRDLGVAVTIRSEPCAPGTPLPAPVPV